MRSNLNPAWSIEIDAPFLCRDYEAAWSFDRSITRVLVAGVDSEGAGQFSELLKHMQGAFGNLLLEADEFWGDMALVQRTLQRNVHSSTLLDAQNWRTVSQRMLADGIVTYDGLTCSFLVNDCPLEELLDQASVREWWGSYWQGKPPFSLLEANEYEYKLDRIEPAMLKSMESCSPIFFLSPNHAHLELMANPQHAEKLVERLALY